MLDTILFALWFFVPAGVANVAPIFAARVSVLRSHNAPLDGGRHFRGKRIFGDHKTWRGLAVGIVAATCALWLQQRLVSGYADVSLFASFDSKVTYSDLPTLLVGPLFAIGALGGDAVESFFKRQLNIAPGKSWFPFDQIDYIIGGAIATAPFAALGAIEYVWLLFVWLVVHITSTVIGYYVGLKDQPI